MASARRLATSTLTGRPALAADTLLTETLALTGGHVQVEGPRMSLLLTLVHGPTRPRRRGLRGTACRVSRRLGLQALRTAAHEVKAAT